LCSQKGRGSKRRSVGEQGVELVGGETQRRRPGEMRHKTGPLGPPSWRRDSSLKGQLKWSWLTRQRGGKSPCRGSSCSLTLEGSQCACIYAAGNNREQAMYLKEIATCKERCTVFIPGHAMAHASGCSRPNACLPLTPAWSITKSPD
jgi:hypothetical protein